MQHAEQPSRAEQLRCILVLWERVWGLARESAGGFGFVNEGSNSGEDFVCN